MSLLLFTKHLKANVALSLDCWLINFYLLYPCITALGYEFKVMICHCIYSVKLNSTNFWESPISMLYLIAGPLEINPFLFVIYFCLVTKMDFPPDLLWPGCLSCSIQCKLHDSICYFLFLGGFSSEDYNASWNVIAMGGKTMSALDSDWQQWQSLSTSLNTPYTCADMKFLNQPLDTVGPHITQKLAMLHYYFQ